MALFGRGKSSRSNIPLASDEPVERWRRRIAEAGLRVVRITQNEQGTYQTLAGDDPEQAKAFLRKEPIEKERYYIVVETPDGNWGTDINGLYLEKLRPWQLDTANVDCTGQISALIDGNQSMEAAANGWADNYVVEVACGRCGREWIDGVRYRDRTVVRCPGCQARNLVESTGYTFTRITY